MEVTYENSFDDMVALTEHQLATSSAYQNRRRWRQYGSPLLFVVAFAYLAYSTQKPALAVGGVLGAVFLFFWSWRAYRNFPRQAVERLQRKKPQKEVLCRHTINVSAEGISEETAESRHFQTWAAIHDVAVTADYIFIYNTPATAHIIPRREVGDVEFQKLREEIEHARND